MVYSAGRHTVTLIETREEVDPHVDKQNQIIQNIKDIHGQQELK